MDYQFEQVVSSSGKIFKKDPERILTSQTPVAVILHLFYPDLWEEVHNYLLKLDTPHDLYITVPPQTEDSVLQMLLRDRPDAHVYIAENRGRDVLPFLLVSDLFEPDTYANICKVEVTVSGEPMRS